MSTVPSVFDELEPRTSRFYLNALRVLSDAKVPYLLGGAYALAHYTGIVRHTKDLDLFVRPADAPAPSTCCGMPAITRRWPSRTGWARPFPGTISSM